MKAIIANPKVEKSVGLIDVPKPKPAAKDVLFKVHRLGIDGTDKEIYLGLYGTPPEGFDYLILGHETLGTIEELGPEVTGFEVGDMIVPTVRRPDDCPNCLRGQSDMCLYGNYKEHGIFKLHGFASEYSVSNSEFLVNVPGELEDVAVLLEPLSVAEKATYQISKIQERMFWEPKKALVLGAGALGLLGTFLLRLKGFDVSTVATRPKESLKARIVEEVGAKYIDAKESPVKEFDEKFDVILEATGDAQLAADSLGLSRTNGVVCFLGVYSSRAVSLDMGDLLRTTVLGNRLFFGSVNANRRYFELGLEHMLEAKRRFPGVLEKLFTSMLPPQEFLRAFQANNDEIKTVINFS